MKILVTGAAGFIGSQLSESLAKSNHEIIGIDSFNDYYPSELKKYRSDLLKENHNIEIEKVDLANRHEIERIFEIYKPSFVIHLAAQAGVRIPLISNRQYVDSNLLGFMNVLELCLINKVQKFIFASSSSVYGNSTNFPYREDDSSIYPISYYGSTKLANEFFVRSLIRNSPLKAIALRFFTVYGPLGRPDMAYFRIAHALVNDKEFHVYGDGNIERDFTYIDDTIIAIEKFMKFIDEVPEGTLEVFNIGGGQPQSLNMMINEFEEIFETKLKIRRMEKVVQDTNKTIASTLKLEKAINFVPKINLNSGIAKIKEWILDEGMKENLSKWTSSK